MSEQAPRQFTAPGFDDKGTSVIKVVDNQEGVPAQPESAPEVPVGVRRDLASVALTTPAQRAQNPEALRARLAKETPWYSVADQPTLSNGQRDYRGTSLGAAANKPNPWLKMPMR